MRFPRINGLILASILVLALAVACGGTKKLQTVSAWSDGTYNPDTSQIGYGTHDWVAEHALDLLPSNESGWLTSNK